MPSPEISGEGDFLETHIPHGNYCTVNERKPLFDHIYPLNIMKAKNVFISYTDVIKC